MVSSVGSASLKMEDTQSLERLESTKRNEPSAEDLVKALVGAARGANLHHDALTGTCGILPSRMPNLSYAEYQRQRKAAHRARGQFKLSRLRPKHNHIITLHMRGFPNVDIANLLGYSEGYISVILNDPLAKEEIEALRKEMGDDMLKDLMPRTVERISHALNNDDPKNYLKAADMVLRANGKYKESASESETAEDVIKRVLEFRRGDDSITLTEERSKG